MKSNFKAVFRTIENKRGQIMSLNKKMRSKISKEETSILSLVGKKAFSTSTWRVNIWRV